MAKNSVQLDREIAKVLGQHRKAGARKKKVKDRHEIRLARLKALRGVMADTLGDDGWLETDPNELDSWISVDDDASDRTWFDSAKNQLCDQSVAPEHAGAPPPNVRAWNDSFISTYLMNIDSGMNAQDAIDSARCNANDTVTLASNERGLTRDDPKLYGK